VRVSCESTGGWGAAEARGRRVARYNVRGAIRDATEDGHARRPEGWPAMLPTPHADGHAGGGTRTRKPGRSRRRSVWETPLGENGGDVVRAPRRIASHHRRHCRSPLPPSSSFFLRLYLPLVRVLLEILAERPASPNLDINAGCRHHRCSYLLFVCCSSLRDSLF